VCGHAAPTRLTSAPDGSLTVLCTPRAAGSWQFTTTSTDGGAHFRAGGRRALGGARITAFAASSAGTVVVSSDAVYRTGDGGWHFRLLHQPLGGRAAWLGFATARVGHGVSADHEAIWTTTDGGAAWRVVRPR
jgi:photosystem II stability/assembly factor-like uncharacterized protein